MTTKTNKFPSLSFDLSQSTNCCGVYDLGNFEEEEGYYSWGSNTRVEPKFFRTQVGQFRDFDKQLKEALKEERVGMLQATLVKKGWFQPTDDDWGAPDKPEGQEEQIPGLIDHLLKKGWQQTAEFVNPKTKHTVVSLIYVCQK